MKNLIQFSALILLFLYAACKEKPASIYENCCDDLPTIESVEMEFDSTIVYPLDTIKYSQVYISNAFTVKTDSTYLANDAIFYISADNKSVIQIIEFIVRDDLDNLLFFNENFQPNDPVQGWTGILDDGSYYFGPFRYTARVKFIDGKERYFSGRACALECGANDFPQENLPDCFFPSQNDGQGGYDPRPPFSLKCF